MDDAQRIFEHLPLSFKNPIDQNYFYFLWDIFKTGYEAENYPFAFIYC